MEMLSVSVRHGKPALLQGPQQQGGITVFVAAVPHGSGLRPQGAGPVAAQQVSGN